LLNQRAHKCGNCKRTYEKAKFDQKYCSHRCRQAAYRKRHRARYMKGREVTPAIPTICEHCTGTFWAKTRRARFCSTSCRTLYHRALRAAIPPALATIYGIPTEKAADLLDTQELRKLRGFLEQSGYRYQHQERAWFNRLGL